MSGVVSWQEARACAEQLLLEDLALVGPMGEVLPPWPDQVFEARLDFINYAFLWNGGLDETGAEAVVQRVEEEKLAQAESMADVIDLVWEVELIDEMLDRLYERGAS